MRVTIDGSFLHLPPSGTGVYLRALVDALQNIASDLELSVIEPDWSPRVDTHLPILSALGRDRRVQRAMWDLLGVRRAARATKPDLLHIPHFSAPLRGATPLIVTIHDVIPLLLPEYRASRAMRIHLTIVRRTVQRARLILTPSQAAAADIRQVLGIPANRIRVTPEAAGPEYKPPLDRIAVQRSLQRLGVRGRYIFNVGGFDVRKNLPTLLAAFARVVPQITEPLQLVIAGAAHSGNPIVFPPLEPEIKRLGLTDSVLLTGRISEADKLLLYQGADIYVTPSLYEGFGLTVLEAMASGTPVIAANRTSLPEVVGDAGLLVDPQPEILADAIVQVLTSTMMTDDLRKRGLVQAAQFSWQRTAQLTLAAYRDVLGE